MTADMNAIIQPRSDQLNADSLLSGPITVRITDVSIRPGTEQPISVNYEGDEGRPWKPCKSMARVLVSAWGPDAREYVGRSVTLYHDPSVRWGGLAVGGVRVSHLSHIERDMVMALTMTKGKKAPYTVKPLRAAVAEIRGATKEQGEQRETEDKSSSVDFDVSEFDAMVTAVLKKSIDPDALTAWWDGQKPNRLQARQVDKAKAGEIATKVAAKIAELTADLEGA